MTKAPAVHFEWRFIRQRRCLVVRFEGQFSTLMAEGAATRMVRHLKESLGPCCLVWDCLAMSGYDPAALTIWQATLKTHRDQVSAIHVISHSLLVRLGAAGAGAFTKVRVKAWGSERDIVFDTDSLPPRPSVAPL